MKTICLVLLFAYLANGHSNQEPTKIEKFHLSYPLKSNWFQAFESCRKQDWDLISIDSKEKHIAMQEYLNGLNLDTDFSNFKEQIWTSGSDLGKEGHYVWMTLGKHLSSAELEFSKFDNHVHVTGRDEDCVAILKKAGHGVILNDEDCQKKIFFMCENVHNITKGWFSE